MYMKNTYRVLLVLVGFLVAGPASAQMGMMNYSLQNNVTGVQSSPAISASLQAIYTSQAISDQSKVDCSKVSDGEFETLGDAVMGYGITEQRHTAMENMMGGEGSATLKQAHITMGRSYLGCWANYKAGPMSMMGYSLGNSSSASYGPFGYGMMGAYSGGLGMMSGFSSGHFYWFCAITLILFWIALILSILALVKWLKKNYINGTH